eukprot:TRINITY_DN2486_c0_g1_i14.p1 TRINITY_DN2486_c0_g1~~TRINITY_DN2486_c0_g1_i14.p1  ORF type:complete len:213 (+),score=57.44 TRINITY_DN2486_c0_g1_i14:724-1362(+)
MLASCTCGLAPVLVTFPTGCNATAAPTTATTDVLRSLWHPNTRELLSAISSACSDGVLDTDSEYKLLMLQEWVGLVACRSPCVLEGGGIGIGGEDEGVLAYRVDGATAIGDCGTLSCQGLIPPSFVLECINQFSKPSALSTGEWVCVVVWGHTDSAVTWGEQRHARGLTSRGNNVYTIFMSCSAGATGGGASERRGYLLLCCVDPDSPPPPM